jgi:hypothetical protein
VELAGYRVASYSVLMGKPEEKRALGMPRRRYDYNVNVVNKLLSSKAAISVDICLTSSYIL